MNPTDPTEAMTVGPTEIASALREYIDFISNIDPPSPAPGVNRAQEHIGAVSNLDQRAHSDCQGCGLPAGTDPYAWAPTIWLRRSISTMQLYSSAQLGCSVCGIIARVVGWLSCENAQNYRQLNMRFGPGSPLRLGLTADSNRVDAFSVYTPTEHFPQRGPMLLPGDHHFRPVQNYPFSPKCVQLVQTWFRSCCENHQLCAELGTPYLPTRILRITDGTDAVPSIRLVEHSLETPPYLALSHAWGRSQPLTTTTTNLDDRKANIAWSSLPPTFKDAVLVCKALGLSHIWIDSLCILQDSRHDWAKEAARMKDVYVNAAIVVAATSSSGADEGFLSPRDILKGRDETSVLASFPVMGFDKASDVHVCCHVPHSSDHGEDGPLTRRGWAFQERLLARRLLSFDKNEIHWECETTARCECGADDYTEREDSDSFPLSRLINNTTLESVYEHWYEDIVGAYSEKQLSYSSDKLPALSALARTFQEKLDDDYLAGLWRRDLRSGILWSRSRFYDLEDLLPAPPALPAPPYRAPSWSWASIDSQVFFPCNDRCFRYEAAILNCSVIPASSDPTGEVVSAHLVIKGAVSSLKIVCPPTDSLPNIWVNVAKETEDSFRDCAKFYIDCLLDLRRDSSSHIVTRAVSSGQSDIVYLYHAQKRPRRQSYPKSQHAFDIWCLYLGYERPPEGYEYQAVPTEDIFQPSFQKTLSDDPGYAEDIAEESEHYRNAASYVFEETNTRHRDGVKDNQCLEEDGGRNREWQDEPPRQNPTMSDRSQEDFPSQDQEMDDYSQGDKTPTPGYRHVALVLGRDPKEPDSYTRLGIMFMHESEYKEVFEGSVEKAMRIC
ncbi:HET-domain-containing protein [Polyplosphaeria fusca]|uniref:HET-domain-containing protein n=1 Tax=Polyplosphaeria fusca TaxID=682080 RepID=A0A9P4R3A8_9PLEO|nr:HET-domain-containing protein [Polyplosphaeria fusca]